MGKCSLGSPSLNKDFIIIIIIIIIRSSYFISGFGAGNNVILAMPFNSFLVVVIYIIEIPSFYFGNAT